MVYKKIKRLLVEQLMLCQINNLQMNFINQLLKNLKEEKYIHQLKTIWGADLAYMQLISKFNKGIRFLLCAIDIFSKSAWLVPLKDKKGILIY